MWFRKSSNGPYPIARIWKRLKPAAARSAAIPRRWLSLDDFTDLELAKEGLATVHLALLILPRDLPGPKRLEQFKEFIRAAKQAKVPVLLESGPCHKGWLSPARNLFQGMELCEAEGHHDLILSFNLPTVEQTIANVRLLTALLREKGNTDMTILSTCV